MLARHSLTLVWPPHWPPKYKIPRAVFGLGIEVGVKVDIEEARVWSKVGIR